MSSEASRQTGFDWPGMIAAVFCLGLAAYVLYETQRYTTFGSIFPRTVAIVMIVAAAVLVARVLTGLPRSPVTPIQSLWRPLALIAVMALWAALIGIIGFYPASVVGFICAGILAQFEPWTPGALAKFLAISVSVATAGYAIFAFALKVPFD
ncbi:MAG: tripartite tricarboxylate transporter TctB family protein [Aquisalimonadaceae bacterium]